MQNASTLDQVQVEPQFIAQEIARGKKYFVVVLEMGTRERTDQALVDSLQKQHLLHLFKLRSLGKLVVNGPVFDDRVRGFGIFDASTIEEVQSYMALDPLVSAGFLVAKIYLWMGLPGDQLP